VRVGQHQQHVERIFIHVGDDQGLFAGHCGVAQKDRRVAGQAHARLPSSLK